MRKLIVVVAALMIAATGCGGDDPTPKAKKPRAASSPTEPPKPKFCPLNGKEITGDFDSDRAALAVKIDNHPSARPQAGLDQADIVYEELAEGGITRFLTIFYCSEAAQIGPIRSVRSVDPDILREYDPVLFAYSGGAPHVLPKVTNTQGITDLRHGTHGGAYQRLPGRRAPHNLFSSTEKLRSLPDAEKAKGAPEIGLEFDTAQSAGASPTAAAEKKPSPTTTGSPAPPAAAGPAANTVFFSFGGGAPSRYTYDSPSGAYLRFNGTAPHNSAGGGQLKVVNVVVLKVAVSAGKGSPEITVTGSGEAQVFKNGTSITGKWDRPGLQDKTKLTDGSGAPIKLAPGNTWIHLLPNNRPVTVQ